MLLLPISLALAQLAWALPSQHVFEPTRETYDQHQVWRLNVTSHDHRRKLVEIGQLLELDIWAQHPQSIDVLIPPHLESHPLLAPFLPADPFIPDVQALIASTYTSEPSLASSSSTNISLPLSNPFHDRFHPYAEIHPFLLDLQAAWPDLVTVFSVGQSSEGRDLWAARIGYEPKKRSRRKKEFVLMGGSHGREWIAPSSLLYFAHHLLVNSEAPGVKPLLKVLDFTIIPVLNVDGYEFTHTNSRLWRKTRQIVDKKSGCVGIDTNRNWGYEWSHKSLASEKQASPCADDFPGKHAFQAPETKAVSEYIKTQKVIGFLDLHSYGQLLMYPFSYSCDDFPPDAEDLMEALLGATKALRSVQGTSYKSGQVCELVYRAAGDSVDWTYGNQEIKWSMSMELPDTGTYGFLLPPRSIRPVAEETTAAVMYLAHFVVQKEGGLKKI